jgi:5-(carboxyamino)imidazole ribonucleotide synthase
MIVEPGAIIGIIGGGQLGRMMAIAAAQLGYFVHIYTNEPESPAAQVASQTTVADYGDKIALQAFARSVQVITFEFENIPHKSLEFLEQEKPVFPSANILQISCDRLREKSFINKLGIATAKFHKVTDIDSLNAAVAEIGLPAVLKTTTMGYDGKGQVALKSASNLISTWNNFKGTVAILEQFVDFVMEISVIVACSSDGKPVCYVPVQNIHKNHILNTTIAPAPISPALAAKAQKIATAIAKGLQLRGILAVEMFVTKNQELLVNEIAPRPHNSGHWTMDACITDQFEQSIRAVCGLPLGNAEQLCDATMKNLLGEEARNLQPYFIDKNAKVHLYGKKEIRPGRKMGHVNFLKPSVTPKIK